MYHSITFGDKNTWTDWGLIPTSRPVFNPPKIKSKYVDIPGSDGLLDLSTLLAGRPLFANREGSLEFVVADQTKNWAVLYSDIANYLHGQSMRAYPEDDPDYYYEGRFTLNAWQSNQTFSTITIDYSVAPYKTSVYGTLDEWLWDPFSFEDGIIQVLEDYPIDGETSILIIGYPRKSAPMFTASASMSLVFKGKTYPVPEGVSFFPELLLDEGENILVVDGHGTLTIDYRGGSL